MKKVISTVAIFCLFLCNSLNAQNSISVNDVIYGMMGPAYRDGSEGFGAPWGLHELLPHGVPLGYDWCDGARPGSWLDNADYDGINIWGQCYIPATGSPETNYRVQIRNMYSYKFVNNNWVLIEETPNTIGGGWYQEDFDTNNITQGNQRYESLANGGGLSATMTPNNTFHFWTDTWPRAQMPQTAVAIYATFEIRLIPDTNPNVNLSNVQLYAGLGMDGYTTRDYSAGANERITSLAISRMQRVTSAWKTVGMYITGPTTTTFTDYNNNVKNRPLPPGVTNGVNIAVSGISLSPANIILAQGASASINPIFSPSNASNQNIVYNSSNNNVATVTAGGVVTGVSIGNVTITATTADGNFIATNTVTITQMLPSFKIMPLGDSKTEGGGGGGHQSWRGYLRAKLMNDGYTINNVGDRFSPADGDGFPADSDHAGHGGYTIGPDTQTFCNGCETTGLFEHVDTWLNDSNPDIVLLAIGINDFYRDANFAATAPQRYENLVNKIIQTKPNVKLVLGTIEPVKYDNTWGSDPNDNDLGALNAKIKALADASSTDNIFFADIRNQMLINWSQDDYYDDVHLTAIGAIKDANAWYNAIIPIISPSNIAVAGISVTPIGANIVTGGTQALIASIVPANASNTNVVWSTSNSSIASVSTNGLVTGNTIGSATITATTQDGNIVAQSTITVSALLGVNSQTLFKNNFKVYPNPVTKDLITIEMTNTDENSTITIYDITGRIFYEKNLEPPNKNIIDINGLNLKGLYFIDIKNNANNFVEKLIIK